MQRAIPRDRGWLWPSGDYTPPTDQALTASRSIVPVNFPLRKATAFASTAGSRDAKDGEHRLSNGSLFTVQGFNRRGDIVVDGGWIIDRDFGHLAHGYVATSHATQGTSVDKVFVGMSGELSPGDANQRSWLMSPGRGKQQVLVYTDDRKELLKAISRPDEPLTATELAESMNGKLPSRNGHANGLAALRQQAAMLARNAHQQATVTRAQRELDHDR